jgi:Mor family transcriptional regulator
LSKLKLSELLLYYISEQSLMMEIVEVIGLDNALSLISVFGGETLKIPKKEDIKEKIIDILIFITLYESGGSREVVNQLSCRYNMSPRAVTSTYNRVESVMENSPIIKLILGERFNDTPVSKKTLEKYILDLLG